jgi:hypothetical protein
MTTPTCRKAEPYREFRLKIVAGDDARERLHRAH